MKKEERKPEIGDVWQIHNAKIHIAYIHNGFVDTVYKGDYDYFYDRTYTVYDIMRDGKYLGKSKASIEQLFKVESEE